MAVILYLIILRSLIQQHLNTPFYFITSILPSFFWLKFFISETSSLDTLTILSVDDLQLTITFSRFLIFSLVILPLSAFCSANSARLSTPAAILFLCSSRSSTSPAIPPTAPPTLLISELRVPNMASVSFILASCFSNASDTFFAVSTLILEFSIRSLTIWLMCSVDSLDWSASSLICSATTAKPLPFSPALALQSICFWIPLHLHFHGF